MERPVYAPIRYRAEHRTHLSLCDHPQRLYDDQLRGDANCGEPKSTPGRPGADVRGGENIDARDSRFYAVTGFPLKEKDSTPADLAYLDSPKIAGLSNLSSDINLAARNALAAMIDYIMSEYGYDRTQAYMIASIAVDMRIGQLVDVPNVGVTAVLPLDIFVGRD